MDLLKIQIKAIGIAVCAILFFCILPLGCVPAMTAEKEKGLIISEVVGSNSASLVDPVYGQPDWIEIVNQSDKSVNLLGYTLSTSKSDANKFVFPDIKLGAGQYLVLYACKPLANAPEGTYCTGFKVSKQGTKLILSTDANIIVQDVEVPALETDISYAADETGAYKFCTTPTPGTPNKGTFYDTLSEIETAQTVSLGINEVLPEPLSNAGSDAWAELFNAGKEAVELSNYYLTEDPSNPTKGRLPQKTLAPGEYTVVRFTGGTGADEISFKISSTEHMLSLCNSFGTSLDTINWDASILPEVSVGRAEDGSIQYFNTPTPSAQNGTDFANNQSFALKEGVAPIQITEVLKKNIYSVIDADGDRPAWVELYNASDAPVSLKTYALSDDSQELWKWMLPDVKLDPKSYTLVFLSGKDRKEGELHANFRLGSADSSLMLTSKVDRIVQTIPISPQSKDNTSYGMDASGQWLYYPQPTPLEANSTKGFLNIAEANLDDFGGLKINEVMAVNTAKSHKPDWVELYNSRSEEVDLTGYHLSDDDHNLKKWPINNVKIAPNGYAVIDSVTLDEQGKQLAVSAAGERLFFSDPQGNVLDVFDSGVLRPNVSSGLSDTADHPNQRAFFKTATPGAINSSDTVSGICAPPRFSANGGFVEAPFTLSMSAQTPNAAIYYTTDGSTPTTSSSLYTAPFEISATQTVRAIAVAENWLNSDEAVATYLFEKRHSLPVICLSMTQTDLSYVFGSPDRKEGRERMGYVEYYDKNGQLGVRFPAGFRIGGNGTRLYPQRTINLYLRGAYGRSDVTYPFFDNYPITTFKSLTLRNMGQDRGLSCIRDAYFGMVVKGMNIDYMEANFAAVYINGKYWGLYEFKENQNEDFFAARHGIDPDKIEAVRSNTYAYKGSNRDIKSLFAASKGNTGEYDIFKAYTDRADSDYFTDYLIAQTYFCNSDAYNQKYARTTDNKMKWRPFLYDLDYAFMGNNPKRSIIGTFFNSEGVAVGVPSLYGAQNHVETSLFYAFYKNAQWRDQFVKRYAQVLDTTLATQKMLDTYDAMVASIRDEMPRHIERWGTPGSMAKWENEIKALRNCIAERRPYAISSLKSFFDLTDDEIKALFPND